jgi:hypothetical protein
MSSHFETSAKLYSREQDIRISQLNEVNGIARKESESYLQQNLYE